ncbi:MAG TPA: hypothetical protein VI248_15200 [Kineosporiaceae bacterium]
MADSAVVADSARAADAVVVVDSVVLVADCVAIVVGSGLVAATSVMVRSVLVGETGSGPATPDESSLGETFPLTGQ